jgi:molybdenum cofactor cytidylyltransferase
VAEGLFEPIFRALYEDELVVRGLVLAAGASSRMGSPKAALPLADRSDTFLARILRIFVVVGVPEIVVVTGANAELVRAAAGRADPRVRFVHNADWPSGQLSSLVTGLDAATDASRASDRLLEAVMMTLVDVPLVSVDTCRRVLATWRGTRAPIVRPARGDEHGHPVIFDRAIFGELRTADRHVGAKAVVRAHANEIVNVPIEDEGAFLDIDTAPEYQAVLDRLRTPGPAR